jgi:hypothetical protein
MRWENDFALPKCNKIAIGFSEISIKEPNNPQNP